VWEFCGFRPVDSTPKPESTPTVKPSSRRQGRSVGRAPSGSEGYDSAHSFHSCSQGDDWSSTSSCGSEGYESAHSSLSVNHGAVAAPSALSVAEGYESASSSGSDRSAYARAVAGTFHWKSPEPEELPGPPICALMKGPKPEELPRPSGGVPKGLLLTQPPATSANMIYQMFSSPYPGSQSPGWLAAAVAVVG
jgi:hypothetical protein